MKILFWIYKSRVNIKGNSLVKMRITINGKRIDYSTSIEVPIEKWDQRDQRIRGMDKLATQYNNTLTTLSSLAWENYNQRLRSRQPITAEIIKAEILGNDKPNYSLLEAIDYQITNLNSRVGNDISVNTVKKYQTIKTKVFHFLQYKFKRNDYYLYELCNKFIFDFDQYLRSEKRLSHNAIAKNMQQLRRVITIAIQNEWISNDPFSNYKIHPKETERGFLTIEEINAISNAILVTRLEKVRDIFLFCCYTGLAYADVSKLNNSHIEKAENGRLWIFLSRTKSKSQSIIPILPQAEKIIVKYRETVPCRAQGNLLPVISNQNLNKYLKEIGIMVGIQKRMSMHLARHTFASTITLNRGVDIVTVSKMLGHRNLRTTQVYAKISLLKIAQDMEKFFQ